MSTRIAKGRFLTFKVNNSFSSHVDCLNVYTFKVNGSDRSKTNNKLGNTNANRVAFDNIKVTNSMTKNVVNINTKNIDTTSSGKNAKTFHCVSPLGITMKNINNRFTRLFVNNNSIITPIFGNTLDNTKIDNSIINDYGTSSYKDTLLLPASNDIIKATSKSYINHNTIRATSEDNNNDDFRTINDN